MGTKLVRLTDEAIDALEGYRSESRGTQNGSYSDLVKEMKRECDARGELYANVMNSLSGKCPLMR
jgi:hypothetical protein